MIISSIPEIYIGEAYLTREILIHDLKMSEQVIRSKVQLNMHMFSFLQEGKKQIHFANTAVAVNKKQSLLIKKGNALWTELLDHGSNYYCKLLFFSEEKLREFLTKHAAKTKSTPDEKPFFVIQNDAYISAYFHSLASIGNALTVSENLLAVKFEELMLYLTNKYGNAFITFLHSLIEKTPSSFRTSVQRYRHANLKIIEIAFLCNMSLSSFKRHFKKEFGTSPGKWLQNNRLKKAREILERGDQKPSEIYHDFGYNNLSNFSLAFKKTFGINPSEIEKNT
ncbi:MAG TPA: helix-turn-helix domain-containing protein [Leeuwenhoekiella sp.]|nr:helix-turn-helix domain-containing protein [Leeuwenhoekiella sp.]